MNGRPRIPFITRVDKSGECWLWTGPVDEKGYGYTGGITQRTERAHRVAWQRVYGPIPKGMFVCHHCDTPSCVRVSHLFLGTAADNTRDASIKGRMSGPRPNRWRPALSAEEVRAIRARRLTGESMTSIATALGVTRATVSHVLSGRRHGSVAA